MSDDTARSHQTFVVATSRELARQIDVPRDTDSRLHAFAVGGAFSPTEVVQGARWTARYADSRGEPARACTARRVADLLSPYVDEER
jgi:hypothetical protein